MLLVVVKKDNLREVAEALGCSELPREIGDVAKCGEYGLYLNDAEEDHLYLGVTILAMWEDWEYRYDPATVERPEAEELLRRLCKYAALIAATPAPAVRPEQAEVGLTAFHYTKWVWIRDFDLPHKAYELAESCVFDLSFLDIGLDIARAKWEEGPCGGKYAKCLSSTEPGVDQTRRRR